MESSRIDTQRKFRSSLEIAEEDAGILSCRIALRALFLSYARVEAPGVLPPSTPKASKPAISLPPASMQPTITKATFMRICETFKVFPVLLNQQETQQAFEKSAGERADLKSFLAAIEICSLAFARPPHNVKPTEDGSTERMQYNLWRFMGLHDGSYKSKLI